MRAAALTIAAALALAGCASTNAAPRKPAPPAAPPTAARARHVVVVVMENKEAGDVIGSPSAPYENALARRYGQATRAYGIRHPSLPNYVALTSGGTQGVDSDCATCTVHARNIVDQLERAHLSWRAYMQDLPSPCFAGDSHAGYAKKHDPFLVYADVQNDPRRCHDVVPLTRLADDLRAHRLPAYTWISPDLCSDTHDCGVGSGDRFLRRTLPPVLRALGPRDALFLLWDEGSSDAGCCGGDDGGRIPLIVAGPAVRPGARLSRPVDHYSALRRIEDMLGLPRMGLARSSASGSLDPLFRR